MTNSHRRPVARRLTALTVAAATSTALLAAATGVAEAAPGGQPGLNSTIARSTQDTASKLAGLTSPAPAPAPAPVYVAPAPAPAPVYQQPTYVAPAPAPAPVYEAPAPAPAPVYVAPAPVYEAPVIEEAPATEDTTETTQEDTTETDIITGDTTLTQDEGIITSGAVNTDRFPELHTLPEGRSTPLGDTTLAVPVGHYATNPTFNEDTGNTNGYQLSGSLGEGFSAATAEQLSHETGYTTASTVQAGDNRVGVATSYETNKDYNRAMAVNGTHVGQGMYAVSSDDHGNNTATATAAVDWTSTDGVVSLAGAGTGTLANFGLENPDGELTLTIGNHSTTWSI